MLMKVDFHWYRWGVLILSNGEEHFTHGVTNYFLFVPSPSFLAYNAVLFLLTLLMLFSIIEDISWISWPSKQWRIFPDIRKNIC